MTLLFKRKITRLCFGVLAFSLAPAAFDTPTNAEDMWLGSHIRIKSLTTEKNGDIFVVQRTGKQKFSPSLFPVERKRLPKNIRAYRVTGISASDRLGGTIYVKLGHVDLKSGALKDDLLGKNIWISRSKVKFEDLDEWTMALADVRDIGELCRTVRYAGRGTDPASTLAGAKAFCG